MSGVFECPFCDKDYSHYSSRARHITLTHPEKNSCDYADDHDDEKVSENDDDGDSHDEEETSDNDDDEPEDSDEQSMDMDEDFSPAAWKTVTIQAFQRLRREKPFLTNKELWEEPELSSLMLPMLQQIIREHTLIVDGIQDLKLFDSMEKTKKKLLAEGLKDWEAEKATWEKRKHYIKASLQKCAESSEDGCD